MKKAPNVKIGCKSCGKDYMLDDEWINEKGFSVKIPEMKVSSIISKSKKKKSSKAV